MRSLSLSSTLLVATLLTAPAFAQEATPAAPRPHSWPATLVVTAEAKAKATPDMATVSAGVISASPTAGEALKKNSAEMTAVIDSLKKAGIDAKDIQTSGLNVSPQYAYADGKAPKITGYQVNNSVTVVLRDMTKIGDAVDALVAQGANQISGPNFGLEDSDAALDSARAEAVQKAKARAGIYAKASGLNIARIMNITEGGAGTPVAPPMPMMRAMAVESSSVRAPVEAGQLDLATSVTVTFELAP